MGLAVCESCIEALDPISSTFISKTFVFSYFFANPPLPESTPDGGVLCFVLRTGVYSFQGDLRRTIDFGSHGVREESKDAGKPDNLACFQRC